jgi:hypothetical protein
MQEQSYRLSAVGRIPLKDRHGAVRGYATVDIEDFSRTRAISWHLVPTGYVRGHLPGSKPKTKYLLHRFILGLPAKAENGVHVDHKDHDRLNNRRENLRTVTQAQNNQNTSGWSKASSKHRGVCFYKRDGTWQANATVNYKPYYLGRYKDELEAARVVAAFRAAHMPFSEETS